MTIRGLADRVLFRFGYSRRSRCIQGTIEWKSGEPVFVDLTVPGGNRVAGWVDSRVPAVIYGSYGFDPYPRWLDTDDDGDDDAACPLGKPPPTQP